MRETVPPRCPEVNLLCRLLEQRLDLVWQFELVLGDLGVVLHALDRHRDFNRGGVLGHFVRHENLTLLAVVAENRIGLGRSRWPRPPRRERRCTRQMPPRRRAPSGPGHTRRLPAPKRWQPQSRLSNRETRPGGHTGESDATES